VSLYESFVSRCPLLVEFALATLNIALNGRILTFLLPLVTGPFGAIKLWTLPVRRPFATLIPPVSPISLGAPQQNLATEGCSSIGYLAQKKAVLIPMLNSTSPSCIEDVGNCILVHQHSPRLNISRQCRR